MIGAAARRPARRAKVSLTPLVDVTFILLVFFMLATRFGQPGAIELAGATGGSSENASLQISLSAQGLTMDGAPASPNEIVAAAGERSVVVNTAEGVAVQSLVDAIEELERAGVARIALSRERKPAEPAL